MSPTYTDDDGISTTYPPPESIRAQIRDAYEWYGAVTLDNVEAVTERMRSMLTGRSWTWVSLNFDGDTGRMFLSPEIRTAQRLDHNDARSGLAIQCETKTEGPGSRPWAHVWWHDTYGIGGFHTNIPTLRQVHKAKPRDVVRVTFKGGFHPQSPASIEIEHYAPAGNRLVWTFAIDQDPDVDLVAALYAQERGMPGSWHNPPEEAQALAREAIRLTGKGWEDVDMDASR